MPEPTKIPRPFADSGDKNTIPDSSGGLGFASWQEGFPAITGTPFAQGGVAPKRADFNGVFNALSVATVWNQQGGVYAYDNTTDYEVGNVVLYSGNLYKCITANGPGSAVKAPTDTTVWDAIATASGYLPLTGGTITGGLAISGYINKTVDNDRLTIYGGTVYTKGAYLTVRGVNDSTNPGSFKITATDGVNFRDFVGQPDGTLTWNGTNVITSAGGTLSGAININQSSVFTHHSVAKGTTPGTTDGLSFWFGGSASSTGYAENCTGLVANEINTSNDVVTYIRALRNQASSTVAGTIGVHVDNNGNIYTEAPTPVTTDNSTKIATTAFVNGFASDKIARYIQLNTNESMTFNMVGDSAVVIAKRNLYCAVLVFDGWNSAPVFVAEQLGSSPRPITGSQTSGKITVTNNGGYGALKLIVLAGEKV